MNIVFLHGWGFNRHIWHSFLPHLNPIFKIHCLDLQGFGDNPLDSKTLTLDSLTQDVLKKSPENAVFIGWSLGGLVAMNIAIHYPERISHLMTLASTPKFVATKNWPGMSLPILQQFYQALCKDTQATLQQFIMLQFHGDTANRSLIHSLKQQIQENTPPSERALKEGLHLLETTDLRNQLSNIRCPQHYLFGRCDKLVPEKIADEIKSFTQNATTIVLPKVSHAPFLTNPKLCAEYIENALQC